MPDPVRLRHDSDIAIVTADNPPVNALSHAVRAGLEAAFERSAASGCKAIVLNCAGRTFFAGADISEFGKPPADPLLPQVLQTIESSAVPWWRRSMARRWAAGSRPRWPAITASRPPTRNWACPR